MKRVLASVFGTIAGLVMLLSFKTQSTTAASVGAAGATGTTGTGTTGTTSGTSGTSGTTSTTSGTTGGSSSSSSSAAPSTSGTKTVTGDVANTQWGPVQVRITVSNGKVTNATAVQYPNGNGRDQEINSYALPVLAKETVSASSAKIDMVSGATFTSTGYVQSLQSALNKAGL